NVKLVIFAEDASPNSLVSRFHVFTFQVFKIAPFRSLLIIGRARFKGGSSMAYIIAQPCIGTKDTACVVVCPVDCIHPKKDEPDLDRKSTRLNPVTVASRMPSSAWKKKKNNIITTYRYKT